MTGENKRVVIKLMSWKRLLSFFLSLLGILNYPTLSFAQDATPTSIVTPLPTTTPLPMQIEIKISPPNIPGGLQIITDAGALISATVAIVLIVAALAAFIYLVQGGLRWITSGGDKAGIDAARNQIQAALLGLFIVFAAWAIMLIIQTFFGVTILGNIQIPTPFQFQATPIPSVAPTSTVTPTPTPILPLTGK